MQRDRSSTTRPFACNVYRIGKRVAKGEIQTSPDRTKTAGLNGATLTRRVGVLAAVIVGIYVLDLQLPKEVPLLSFYWFPVLLAATFASPRQVEWLNVEAALLGVASGLQSGIFSHPDYAARLLAQANSHLEATLQALPDCSLK